MSDLRISALEKSFGTVEALRGLDLQVAAGEFFVILGPSAAGKTTTLRSIAGLERPDSGRIVFAGRDMTDQPVQGRDMAMIFQTFALYPHLSVFDNLAYPLREAGIAASEVKTRVAEMAMKKREDIIADGGYPDDIVRNAPEVDDHYFVVPKVVE